MICLPHLFTISTTNMRFLMLGESLIFPRKCKKSYLRVSEDSMRIPWRMESVESYVVLVSLWRFATV